MRILFYILLLAFGFGFNPAQAQMPKPLSDSVQIFHFNIFLQWVRVYHPIAKQAELEVQKGKASILEARGAFDPKAFLAFDQKQFSAKEYFSILDAGLKIPTWFGVELKAGFEQNEGIYLNPENNTPANGLYYTGISIPLGQNLFIDSRRNALKQAKLFAQVSEWEQKRMLNELIFDAAKAYLDWAAAFANLTIYREFKQTTQTRFEATKAAAQMGERPLVDTLEAGIQLQDRSITLLQAELDYLNKTMFLSTFLWNEEGQALEVSNQFIPETILELKPLVTNVSTLKLDSLIQQSPELQLAELKIRQLKQELRFKADRLKPQLNINYNPLTKRSINDFPTFNTKDYKWGLDFSMPLLLRKERGALQLARYKLQESELALQQKNTTLLAKTKAYYNEYQQLEKQLLLIQKTTRDYQFLVQGEQRLFDSGESSLFLVNARELAAISANTKLIEIKAKGLKALLSTYVSLGNLYSYY